MPDALVHTMCIFGVSKYTNNGSLWKAVSNEFNMAVFVAFNVISLTPKEDVFQLVIGI